MFTSFKSDNKSDLYSLNKQLEMLLAEQRLQRSDLAEILNLLHKEFNKVINDENLQKQVDEYFEEDDPSPKND